MDKFYSNVQNESHTEQFKNWIALLNNEILRLRARNDTVPLDEVQENRGAIRTLKKIIAQASSKTTQDNQNTGPN